MKVIILFVTVLVGLCMGSFVHVVISRFSPNKTALNYIYNITLSRSTCPNCHHSLDWCSLISLLSWLKLRGRCQYCLAAISISYPLTELPVASYCLTMILFYEIMLWSIILIALGLYFTVLAIIDFNYLLLLNYFTYPLLLMGLLSAYYEIGLVCFYDVLCGALCGYIILWLTMKIHYLITQRIGLGGGEIKLLAALGTWLPITTLPTLLLSASIIGISYFIIYNHLRKNAVKDPMIPFGSCLVISAYYHLLLL